MLKRTGSVVIALLWLSGTAFASEQATEKGGENEKSLKQFLHVYNYDPLELHEIWRQSEQRKHLAGPLWLGGYYIPPSQQPGPNVGPPLQIWGRGFGTSLWRDPVTGWPIR